MSEELFGKHKGITNEKLATAFGPWSRGEYPEAKNIGDVAVAMSAGEEPVVSAEVLEDQALQAELARDELADVVRPTPLTAKSGAFKGRRPPKQVNL